MIIRFNTSCLIFISAFITSCALPQESIEYKSDFSIQYNEDVKSKHNGIVEQRILGSEVRIPAQINPVFTNDTLDKLKIDLRNDENTKYEFPLGDFPADDNWQFLRINSVSEYAASKLVSLIWNQLGYWSPRQSLNNISVNYQSPELYLLSEEVSRSEFRVDLKKNDMISEINYQVQGGFIYQIDSFRMLNNDYNEFYTYGGMTAKISYPDIPSTLQKEYIAALHNGFEKSLMTGTNIDSYTSNAVFIDWIILYELINMDPLFDYKIQFSKDSKNNLNPLPVEDMRYAWKSHSNEQKLVLNKIPFISSIYQSTEFKEKIRARWKELRKNIISETYLSNSLEQFYDSFPSYAKGDSDSDTMTRLTLNIFNRVKWLDNRWLSLN